MGGRVAVAGSAEMFCDVWLPREGNAALLAWLLAWLQPVSIGVNYSYRAGSQIHGLLEPLAVQSTWHSGHDRMPCVPWHRVLPILIVLLLFLLEMWSFGPLAPSNTGILPLLTRHHTRPHSLQY